jgi:hypothetical protein
MVFDISGLVNDKSSNNEIEFWGHDAGEFFLEGVAELLGQTDGEEVPKETN